MSGNSIEQQTSRMRPIRREVSFSACPRLGLKDDPDTCAVYPRLDHLCSVAGVGAPSIDWQTRYCVSNQHVQCPHLRASMTPPRQSSMRGQGAERWRWLIAGLVVASLAIGSAVTLNAGNLRANGGGNVDAEETTAKSSDQPAVVVIGSPTPETTPSPAVVLQATPTAAPSPTMTSTPTVATAPTTAPSPTAAPVATEPPATPTPTGLPASTPQPETHTVAEGETLGDIASRYGTTIDALIQLNQITDPNTIYTGTVLRLPPTN